MSTYSSTLLCLLVLTSTVYMQTETSDTSISPETGTTTSSDTTATSSTSTVGPPTTSEVVISTPSSTTSTPTQTSLQTNPSNDSETTTPGNSSSTPSSSDAATSTETPSTTLLPTVSNTSEHQTVNNTMEQTSSGTTTAAQSSTASANPTTSVAPTTSTSAATTPTPTSEGKNPDALVKLQMQENLTFSCYPHCNYSSIRPYVITSFAKIDGFYSVREGKIARRRRATSAGLFTVDVLFVREIIITMSNSVIHNKMMEGFVTLNKTVTVHFDEASKLASNFANDSQELCHADNPCKDEYTCIVGHGCSKICTSDTCSNHGACSVVISGDKFKTQCKCDSNDDYEYSGDNCENEEISKAKVIQIVSGVLGAFCALFLLIIIIMCCRRGSSKSSHLYQIGSPGYANDGYSNESELKRM